MFEMKVDPGSFRDPSGHVYEIDNRIFRTITGRASADYEFVRQSEVMGSLAEKGWILPASEIDPSEAGLAEAPIQYVVEHPRLPFISYPYEWCFPALRDAALLHLDLHLYLLERGITLSDASAYNIQFQGVSPVFIDTLSLRRYREGEFWTGHRQFCEQFLNPLLMRALMGVPHNGWYRGSLEGISTVDLARLLPLCRKLSWNVMTQVMLQARLQSSAVDRPADAATKLRERKLPLKAYRGLLLQMRKWIAKLHPADTGRTVWEDYAQNHTYTSEEEAAKRRFVTEFVSHTRPNLLWDLGCNTGDYSAVALKAGARAVIGFDYDQHAVEIAYARAVSEKLNFFPLWFDAANPSPDQGWRQHERKGLGSRAKADAIIALAFEHHLAIGRNIPMDQMVSWLTGLAPTGVIEFVQKSDPTVQRMLALREDIFEEYDETAFTSALERNARIVRAETVSSAGRRLFWFDRS